MRSVRMAAVSSVALPAGNNTCTEGGGDAAGGFAFATGAGGGVYAAAFTGAPCVSRTPPSTTTLSPVLRPSVISQPSPFHSPTTTGRISAWFWALVIHTKCPFALCWTARCGTTIAFGRIAPVRRTRTYWLGRSTPAGLLTVARSRNVPVVGLY